MVQKCLDDECSSNDFKWFNSFGQGRKEVEGEGPKFQLLVKKSVVEGYTGN